MARRIACIASSSSVTSQERQPRLCGRPPRAKRAPCRTGSSTASQSRRFYDREARRKPYHLTPIRIALQFNCIINRCSEAESCNLTRPVSGPCPPSPDLGRRHNVGVVDVGLDGLAAVLYTNNADACLVLLDARRRSDRAASRGGKVLSDFWLAYGAIDAALTHREANR